MFHSIIFTLAACANPSFFAFPAWYKYLLSAGYMVSDGSGCSLKLVNADQLPTVVALIAMGVLDIILRLAGMVAVLFIIYGGVKYMTSYTGQGGGPQHTKEAQETIISAVIGLLIAIVASALVAFIGRVAIK